MPTKKKIIANKDFKMMTINEFASMYCRNEENKKHWNQILNNINNEATPVAKKGWVADDPKTDSSWRLIENPVDDNANQMLKAFINKKHEEHLSVGGKLPKSHKIFADINDNTYSVGKLRKIRKQIFESADAIRGSQRKDNIERNRKLKLA